jgi:hypothetical protein
MKADRRTINEIIKIDYNNSDLQITKCLQKLGTHGFDIFDLRQWTGGNELIATGNYVMDVNDLYNKLNISKKKFVKYVSVI